MFKKRIIQLQFADQNGKIVDMTGYRCQALISNPGGYEAYASLELRVFGMSLDLMNEYSSVGFNLIADKKLAITVMAGDEGGAIAQVFKGSVIRSRIEISQPEAVFAVSAVAGYYDKATSAAANSYQGAQNAEDIIKSLAQSIGYEFINKNNAHSVLQNQYLYGSAIDQINSISRACNLPVVIENDQVIIFPNNGTRDDIVIELSPETGLVGYPKAWEAGLDITAEFNPLIANGRMVKLTSQIPIYNGSWPIQSVEHALSSETFGDSPWFTFCRLSPSNYVPAN